MPIREVASTLAGDHPGLASLLIDCIESLQDIWRRGVYLRDVSLDSISLVDGRPVFDDLGWAISESATNPSTWDADALRARDLLLLGRAFAALAGVRGSPLGSVVAMMTAKSEGAGLPEPGDLVLLLRGVVLLSGPPNGAVVAGEPVADGGAVRIAAALLDRIATLERRLERREGKVAALENELWTLDRELSIQELFALVPRGDSFILVDEGRWGEWPVDGPRALPFPEHEGVFAGCPADGGSALRELLRLHTSGATHVAFPRASCWWLEQYPELRDFLFAHARVVLDNGRLLVYRLAPSA
jgi:hypothetical protein